MTVLTRLGVVPPGLFHILILSAAFLDVMPPILLRMIRHLLFPVDPFSLQPVVLPTEEPEVRWRIIPAPGKGNDVFYLKIPCRSALPASG